jgi:hypothetical protein
MSRLALRGEAVLAARRAQTTPAGAVVRPYRAADRDAVRDICCRTAYRNRGAASVFRDTELFADYHCRYYTDVEPESAWVAEQDDRVVAYLFGCADTRRYRQVMARSIVPGVLRPLLWRMTTRQYRDDPRSRAFLRWLFLKAWREAPTLPGEADAAHAHCNVLPDGYRQQLYSRLVFAFLDDLDARGVTHMCASLLEPRDRPGLHTLYSAYVRQHPGTECEVAERPTDFGRDVLGTQQAMANFVFMLRVEGWRGLFEWLAKRYRL